MNDFAQILAALGPPAQGSWNIGDNPPLEVNYNPNTQVLVAKLNAGVHITIYQNSWDGTLQIMDCTGDMVDVGPYCLHTTAGNERWFRQYENDSWEWVTDCGTPSQRYLQAFDAMMNTLSPCLG
jgi:hypothetical protein